MSSDHDYVNIQDPHAGHTVFWFDFYTIIYPFLALLCVLLAIYLFIKQTRRRLKEKWLLKQQ